MYFSYSIINTKLQSYYHENLRKKRYFDNLIKDKFECMIYKNAFYLIINLIVRNQILRSP
jgi:hypothetical protein